MADTTYYKVLFEDGSVYHGGRGKWHLPKGKCSGKWMHVDGEIIPCEKGLHLCRKQDLVHWIGPVIFVAEPKGEITTCTTKVVVADARLLRRLDTWNETTARLFAADCAKEAVRRCRKAGIEIDPRTTECIRVVYRFARGQATEVELSAAWSAAWPATRSASSSAADAAWSAAWSAADAAWSAWSAADAAVDAAARSWQTKRLFEYLDGKRS